jgi:ribose transport system ATP-binding protein
MTSLAADVAPLDRPPALEVLHLSKSFGGAQALKDVTFSVGPAQIHGLLGQNGSGKSTFVKILAGFHRPDPGSLIRLAGQRVELPLRAAQLSQRGLSFVHQNLGLIPSLTVLENLRIAALTATDRWRIVWKHEHQAARAAFERLDLDIDPRARVQSLSQVDRALVAIVRAFEAVRATQAVHGSPGLLLLDEPTPFLPQQGVERLFSLMRRIVSEGASVIFISHDIDEIRDITDSGTVLRDGRVVGSFKTRESSREALIELIVGRKVARLDTSRRKLSAEAPVAIRQLAGPGLSPINLDLQRSEILGLTGLVGAGHERVLYHLFGAARPMSGTLTLNASRIDLPTLTPRRALAHRIALLPGDRQGASGIGTLNVVDNLFLPDVGGFFRTGWLRRQEMHQTAARIMAEYEARPAVPTMRLGALSGGNAQKLLLARWLRLKPQLLLLEEPTQGVDVGTRQLLLQAVQSIANDGAVVLCASSDHEQLAELCDRVLIFAGGTIVDSLSGADLTKQLIGERCYRSEAALAL